MTLQNIKALVLLSGGLDSMLAVKLLQLQNISVTGLCFHSNFYGCERARIAAAQLGVELIEDDVSQVMFDLVKNPPSGYGKNLNPCIDCHAMMIRRAGEIAREKGFDFVATGEVLGQRPFSQNKSALARVAKLAGIPVLRPLSAKLLDETEIEKKALVNRHRLLDIAGRERERQMELAEKYDIKDYPSPAGGCLLTDPGFSERGAKLLDHWPDCDTNDIELLKHGRVFWLNLPQDQKVLLLIGRHQNDNENLEKLARNGDIMIELKEMNGPTGLVRAKTDLKLDQEIIELSIPSEAKEIESEALGEILEKDWSRVAGTLTAYFYVKARAQKVKLQFKLIK